MKFPGLQEQNGVINSQRIFFDATDKIIKTNSKCNIEKYNQPEFSAE